MNIELPDSLREKIDHFAKANGVSSETLLLAMIETRLKEFDENYPPDEVIAMRVAEDPDAAPLLSWEELLASYKPCAPLVRKD